MSLKRNFLLFCLFLCSISSTNAQGPPRTLSLTATRTLITAGEQIRILARTRDMVGLARPDETFAWSASNPAVLTVDTLGVVTGVGLGTAIVTANLGNLRSTISFEVLPLRVEVSAPQPEMFPGQQMQLTAAALNIAGEPIPGVTFRWELNGANGFTTRAASISTTGLITATANALVTAKASVVYTGTVGHQVGLFSGTTQILIRPKIEFKITRLATNEPIERSFPIQPAYISRIGSNDLGQMAFVAPLDGISNSLVTYDNGRFEVLASAGLPGPQPGSFIWGFDDPAINNKGEVIVRSLWPASGLLLATPNGARYVFLDGQSEGVLERIGNFETTKYSINDNGEILFRANFQFQGTRIQRTGLFKIVNDSLQLFQRNDLPLPGLNENYSIGFFGLDQSGNVFFTATDTTRTALYRADGLSDPVKIAATGEAFAGSTISSLAFGYGFGISSEGTVAYTVRLSNGTSGAARLRPTDSQPVMQAMSGGMSDVFDVAPNGDVLLLGGLQQSGWGLYLWSGDQVAPLLTLNTTVQGSSIWTFFDAFITRNGEVMAYLMTAANDFVMFRPRNSSVAFKSGDAINTTANFNFIGLVQGARLGAGPALLTGGQDVSIYEWTSRGAVPIYVTGQRTVSDRSSWNLGNAFRNAAGDLYFTNSGGIFRSAAGRLETVLARNTNLTYGSATLRLNWFQGWYDNSNTFSVNKDGSVAFFGQTDNGTAVATVERGTTKVLGLLGGRTPTPSPAGGSFSYFLSSAALAIDDGGRVMLGAQCQNGPNGLFIYQDGQWRSAAVINTTKIDGQLITSIGSLKTANGKFYAQFGTANGGWVLGEYSNGSWTSIVKRGDIAPNGAEINFVNQRFDVNRNGDIAYIVNMNSGTAVMLRTADGTNRLAYLTSDPGFTGDPLISFNNTTIDLRDDHRFYFTAVDNQDRNGLYLAEPLF